LLRKIPQKYALTFFLRRGGSKKVSKKGALQLEKILHPSSFKAENFKTRAK
jgi:hypothetical protein